MNIRLLIAVPQGNNNGYNPPSPPSSKHAVFVRLFRALLLASADLIVYDLSLFVSPGIDERPRIMNLLILRARTFAN